VKNTVVARNYAEALIAVAKSADAVERFGELLDAVAGAVASDHTVSAVLLSPRVRKVAKQDLLARALEGVAPDPFVRFLQAVVRRGRQGILGEISEAYQALADISFNRTHASVITAHPLDEALQRQVAARLAALIGKTVIPHFRTDPALMGGVIIRVGDRVLDGSIRRRLLVLKGRMLNPGGAAS
jgi:F-type H+-transporting ATPase subunit delta